MTNFVLHTFFPEKCLFLRIQRTKCKGFMRGLYLNHSRIFMEIFRIYNIQLDGKGM